MDSAPKTLLEAIQYFSDEQICIDAVAAMRWPNGVVCPDCETGSPYYLKTQRRWKCRDCRRQFSVKVETIFEDSPISLTKWLPALWLLVNCKNGVSSHELARALGVGQKAAWFMLHRLRYALKNRTLAKLGGPSPKEVDEAFVGGTPKFMHAKRRMGLGYGIGGRTAKVPVLGMLDRDSRQVRARVVPNVKRETLQNAILKEIETGSTIYTDNSSTLDTLAAKGYVHETVNHVEEYVRGQVHTQGIENFWSLLKRGLKGTYIAVEPFHLDAYVAEQIFRFNNRATKDNPLNDADRFLLALSQVAGKRLTFKELTGKVGEMPTA
jgi:transposase-like protein